MGEILDDLPSDPTDLEDAIQSSLFLGKPAQALAYAAKFDIWLAAHMAHLMEQRLHLIVIKKCRLVTRSFVLVEVTDQSDCW